jgi:hypothetical protein
MTGRPLPPEEVEVLRETLRTALAAGEPLASISKRLGVTVPALYYWIYKFDLRERSTAKRSRFRGVPGGKEDQDALLVALAGQSGPALISDMVADHVEASGLHDRSTENLARRWRIAVDHLIEAGLVVCVRAAGRGPLYDLAADVEAGSR